MTSRWWVLLGLAASVPAAARAADSAAAKAGTRDSCVYITQLGPRLPQGDRSVLFRANVSDYYRLEFAQRCEMLTFPQPKVILRPFAGLGLICRALDVDVSVGDQGPGSIPEPCIPSASHKRTPAEGAAIPKKDLP